ncbi:MAG: nitrite/sulfite reductase [Kiritimatiellae bacterium]|jgi:sulfite reductase beta subunit-like hemoprotein|nr:nitrite/sulfite reductase [Kiritimatiellia bacterium]
MTTKITKELEVQYRELQDKIDEYQRGGCKALDVKKLSALLGVYGEKDGTYMTRVRRIGGEVSVSDLLHTADVMEENSIEHAHFSTRQNIQMHGVPAERVQSTLAAFGKKGMVFRGGGGNTFRSVTGSPYAGVSKTELFDITPYANAVWDYMFNYDKAYHLGRKFKLGFSSERSDNTNCGVQDLGLMAVVKEGQKGFKVYGGGGLGRGGMLGFVLAPFLPVERALQAVVAAIDLFADHGDRENKAKARLRFVREKLGPQGYRELYADYLDKTDAPLLNDVPEIDYRSYTERVVSFQEAAPVTEAYRGWLRRAVQDTKFDNVVAVRMYIRKGIFKAPDLRELAAILKKMGAPCIRLTNQQDAVIPFVHKSALPALYKTLREQLQEQAVTDGSFARHIVSCIGARRCPMGLMQATAAAEAIAESLDHLFLEYEDIRDGVFEGIIDGIRVSGCGSSCGVNQIAAIGFNGHQKKIDGVLTEICQIHIGGDITEEGHYFAVTQLDWWIKVSDIGPFVACIVKEYLDDYRSGNPQSLRRFMLKKREDFDPVNYL